MSHAATGELSAQEPIHAETTQPASKSAKPHPHSDTPINRYRDNPKLSPASLAEVHQSNSWPDPIANMPSENPSSLLTGQHPAVARDDDRRLKEMHVDLDELRAKEQRNEEMAAQRRADLAEHVPAGGIFSAAAGPTEFDKTRADTTAGQDRGENPNTSEDAVRRVTVGRGRYGVDSLDEVQGA